MVSELWNSDDPKLWLDHLEAASERVKTLQNDRLTELDQ